MSSNDERASVDFIMGSLHRLAMQVIEIPRDQREEKYAEIRQMFVEDARNTIERMNAISAAEFADMYMGFLRDVVRIIETSGGAGGGTA